MANVNGTYNHMTIEEIIESCISHGDKVIIHNGQIIGFTIEDNTDIDHMYKNIFR